MILTNIKLLNYFKITGARYSGCDSRYEQEGARNHRRLLGLILSLILLVFALTQVVFAASERNVLVANVEGVINPVVAEYISDSIATAEKEDAEALVILLDTPGGLDTSMRSIIKDIYKSEVPVIVYVSPSGARAASAGTFITLAAHVAAMAPGTNIGAAHPVNIAGDMPDDVREKAENDAVAYIKSIAKKNGRNEEWAEDAVRKSDSITAEQALDKGVIDHVSPDLEQLLDKIDGTTVETSAGSVVLKTKGASTVDSPMSLRQRLLHIIIDPNIAYLLLMLGFYGILFELYNPGLGLSGIGGGISLVLGLYALQVLPVNYAGLALIILGIVLLVAEALNPGFGVLGAGGIASLAIGSLILFKSPLPGLRVSPFVIVPTVLTTAAFMIFVVGAAVRARRRQPVTGQEGMIGLVGEVRKELNPRGEIFVRGERWEAESIKGTVAAGEKVQVVEIEGLRLKVRRLTDIKSAEEGE